MNKKLLFFIVVPISIIAAAAAAYFLYVSRRGPAFQVLDGPGSYVETVTGTVTETADKDEYSYLLTLELDEEPAERIGDKKVRVNVDYDSAQPGEKQFHAGDYVRVEFAGGIKLEGDPKLIDNPYSVELIEDTEAETGSEAETESKAKN